jgi:uncharacterized MAPEG superfamily protein
LVLTKQASANGFVLGNGIFSPNMQRLAQVHANCVAGLPIFVGLMIIALITERTGITDSLTCVFLSARVLQSLIHLGVADIL